MKRLAIIGAGMAGLTIASELKHSADIAVFEKARGPGGRMSTRYAEPYQFDHGAQYFTAKTERFATFLQPLIEQQIVAEWNPAIARFKGRELQEIIRWQHHPRYVATPKMNALCKALAEGIALHTQTRVASLNHTSEGWKLTDTEQNELGVFDWVISTAPAAQTAALFTDRFAHYQQMDEDTIWPCFSLMLGFQEAISLPWDVAQISDAELGWIAMNHRKPMRNTPPSILIQTAPEYSAQHIHDDPEKVKQQLLDISSHYLGIDAACADHISLHRWLYAQAEKSGDELAFIDHDNRLIACGDWCIEGRVEAAFLSAMYVVDELKKMLA